MLAKQPSWPSLKSSTSTGISNETKMQVIQPSSANRNNSDVEDYELVPQFNNSFGDVVAQALQKAEMDGVLNKIILYLS